MNEPQNPAEIEQAPETNPAPVVPSEIQRGEHLPTQTDIEVGISHVVEHHSGPLPSPETLRQYNDIVPDGAERIMAMAEKEQAHRHRMNRSEESRATLGIFSSLGIVIVFAGVASYALNLGYAVEAATILGTTLVGIVGAFIYGARGQHAERMKEIENSSDSDVDTE